MKSMVVFLFEIDGVNVFEASKCTHGSPRFYWGKDMTAFHAQYSAMSTELSPALFVTFIELHTFFTHVEARNK